MRIGFIIPSLANRGPVLVVRTLVQQLAKRNNFCCVFYLTDIVEIEMNCPVQKIKFTESINFQDFDIIHTHGLRPDAYVFFHRFRNKQTKFISTLHNYVILDLSFQYNKFVAYICGNIWMLLLHRHDRIVTLSMDAMEYYTRWFSREKITYVYNSCFIIRENKLSENERMEITSFKGDSFLIGVNTLLTARKGIDQLIKALPELPGCKLCIVGDGKVKDDLCLLAQAYCVYDKCLFVGYKKDAYRYLSYYDIYAMPSRSEGFPLALLEAMMFYKPIVCSDISIFREIFTQGEAALFKLEDINSLISAIKLAMGNTTMGEQMYHHYYMYFTPEKMCGRYLAVYNGEI